MRDNPTKEEAVDESKDWQTQLTQYQSVKDAQHRQHYRALLTPTPNFLLVQSNLSFTTFTEATNRENQPEKLLNLADNKVIQNISIDNHTTVQKVRPTAALPHLIVPAGKTVILSSGLSHRYSYIKLERNATITTAPYNPDTQQGGHLVIYCHGACVLEEGACIHVNGRGSPGRLNGAGHGNGGGEGGMYCAGGGSYRTRGGTGKCVAKQQHKALSGTTYGNGRLHIKGKLPLGSAGGAICFMKAKHSLPGAAGGGALSITIDGTLQLGKKAGFQANGQDSSSSTGGAGSGGTLMLVCKGGIQMPDGLTNLLAVLGGQSLGRYRRARGVGGMGYEHLDYQYTVAPQIKLPHGLACWLTYWMRKSNIKEQPFLFGWIALFVGDSDECFLDRLSQQIANNPHVDNKLQTLPSSKAIYIDYLYEAGQDAYKQKKYGQAIGYYQQVIQNITQQPPTSDGSSTITQKGCYINIAETYVAQGNYTKAVQSYKKAGQKAQSIEETVAQLQRAQQKEIEIDYITQQGFSLYIPLQATDRPIDDLNDKGYNFTNYIDAFTGQPLGTQDDEDKDDAKDDEKKEILNDDVTDGLGNKGQILPNHLQERLAQSQVLLLQGGSGAGKSLAGRYIATQYKLQSKDKKVTWVAVFISLPSNYNGTHLLTEALVDKGLNLLAILALQQSKSVRTLFVLDGFDEIITTYRGHAHLPDKVSERFGFDKWPSSKFIISCRSHGISDNDKCQYLGAHPEVHLVPFAQEQIKQYISSFVQNKALNIAGWSVQQYKGALAKYAGLTDMAREPFSLGLIVNVLPYLNYEKGRNISRAELYEAFTEQWFERQISKLKESKKITIPTSTLKQNFQTYCEDLALAMFKRGQEVADVGQEHAGWYPLFTQENHLQGSPLRKVGGSHYMFIHKSYQAYFVASRFIHNLLHLPKHQSRWEAYNFAPVAWNHKSYQAYFNDDVAVVGFMIDRLLDTAKPYNALKKLLFALIEYSKQNQQVAILAANSATLLCAARVPLSNQKWAYIRIPHARLDQALLTGTDLSHSDSAGVSLRYAYLERTKWQGAKVHGINFGEIPYLQDDSRVNDIVYSPNGSYIATISNSKNVRIWDATTGNLLTTCTGHNSFVTSVAWSPDNRLIASASWDKTVRIWDAQNGKIISTCKGHTSIVNSVAWAPNGQRLASASDDKTVRIWDAATGKFIATCIAPEYNAFVLKVAWSSDSSLIASANLDNTVRIWDAVTGKSIATCKGHTSGVTSVAWAPDNRLIASASWDKTVRIWDATNGKSIATYKGHNLEVTSVAWAPDNRSITSVSCDMTVRIWDSKNGNPIAICKGHTGGVTSVSWSPNNRSIASTSNDKTVRIWDATTSKPIACEGHRDEVNSVSWAPDNKLIASAGKDKTVRIWNVTSGKLIATCKGHTDEVNSVACGPESIASASNDKTVRIWNLTSGKLIATYKGHTDEVNSVAWAPDNKLIASASNDKTVCIWNVASGKLIATYKGHSLKVTSVAWGPNGRRLASASADKTVCIWDRQTDKSIATCKGHTSNVNSVAWSQDGGKIASASHDKTVRIWNATTGKAIVICTGHTEQLTSIAWSQDGGRIASASHDKTVRIWDAANGHILCIIGMEHATLSLTDAHFEGAIGLSDLNKQLIQQRREILEVKKVKSENKHKDSLDDEKKDDV